MRLAPLALLLLGAAASAQTAASEPLAEAAEALAARIEAGDLEALAEQWNADAFALRVVAGLDAGPALVEDVRVGIRQATPFYVGVAEAVSLGATYRFLHLAERDGAQRARFRFIDADGGLNYHDLLFERDARGAYRLVDGYDFMQGEDISRSVQRVMLGMLDGATESEWSARAENIRALGQAAQQGDWETALAAYPRITPRPEDQKPLLLLYLRVAIQADPVAYRKGLEQFARSYADDPDAALVLIDHYALRGDTEAALAAVDVGVGGDPYLDDIRVTLLQNAGRWDDARVAADRLAEALPDLAEAQFPRLDMALADGHFDVVAEGLLRLERDHGIWFDPAVIKADPTWAGFVASPSFKRWQAARAE